MPHCELTINPEGQFVVYVDLRFPLDGPIVEVARCWGSASTIASVAKQDAARVAMQRLKDKLDLQIKDGNYDERLYYKNMYNHLTYQHVVLFEKYGKVKWEFGALKERFNSAFTQNDGFVTEHIKYVL